MPATYRYQQLKNGWERFSNEDGFVAFRNQSASGIGRRQLLADWLDVARGEVSSFTAEEQVQLALAGHHWSRADFSFEDEEDGPVRGFLMATIHDEQEIVAWAEAPAALFPDLERERYLTMVAEWMAHRPGNQGLLYAADFNATGTWGTGELDGARAETVEDAYQLMVEVDKGFYWATAGATFASAIYEVTVTQTAGPLDNGFGLVLRAEEGADSFYLFEISGDGYVWIGRCHQRCATAVSLAGEGWFAAPAVRPGLGNANHLRVEADGARLTFFVNESQVAQISDDTFEQGDVGVFAETRGEGGVTVAFSDLRVWDR
jgi:hypothetical protein